MDHRKEIMKKSFTLIFALFTLFNVLGAQTNGNRQGKRGNGKGQRPMLKVFGKIVDTDTEAPLEFATVTLFSLRDSAMVAGSISNEKGAFVIETRPGRFFAKVEFISYESLVVNDIKLGRENREADLGTIKLASDANMLAEVEVVEEKSQMQFSLDKKVFNVGKDLANIGGTAEDILDNVPSVTVDIEGNVSLRGSDNVRILIDGKPSGLVGIGGSGGLKSIPSNLIDRIEVITNPSARYEAEGMSGIINIVLKKARQKGLNGSFDLTVGYPDNYGAAINLNYRKKNFNFFTNYGIRYRRNPGGGSVSQRFFGDTLFLSEQTRDQNRGGWSNNIRLGADYFFSPKSVLTTSFLYRIGRENNNTEVIYRDYQFDLNNPTEITTRTDDEQEDEAKLEYALNYKKTFSRRDQEWKINVSFQDNVEDESSDFLESYSDPQDNPNGKLPIEQRSANDEGERRLILQTDYVHPIGKEGKLEMGYFSSFRKIKNDFLIEELRANQWTVLDSLSNNFLYEENIHSAYLIFGDKKGKFSYQMGLRTEVSDVKTELETTAELNDTLYIGFFPSAFLNYDLGKNNSVQASYSRRLRRPRFWDLNPFFSFSDPRNYFSGNPALGPEFTNSFELAYIKYWDKASLSSSVYYRHSTNVIRRIREQGAFENTTVTKPKNLDTEDAVGFEFTFSADPFKWWRLSGDANFFYSVVDGTNVDRNFKNDTYSWFARVTSRITLWKQVDFQTRFNYRAPRQTAQGSNKARYNLDLGFSREILNKKGTLTLSVRDLFNTRRRRYITDTASFYAEGDFQWRSRQATLGLNYRLNQKKRRGRSSRGGGGFEGGGEGDF